MERLLSAAVMPGTAVLAGSRPTSGPIDGKCDPVKVWLLLDQNHEEPAFVKAIDLTEHPKQVSRETAQGTPRPAGARQSGYADLVFFTCVFLALLLLGQVGLPMGHRFHDCVVIRNDGCKLSDVLNSANPLQSIVTQAMGHTEGALQYLVLNFYCYLVGDRFPLNPSTMQFPNTVFATLTVIFGFMLGRRILSRSFGYAIALAFLLGPWLWFTIRAPWYFNTLSCLLTVATVYFFTCLIENPDRLRYRVLAPVTFSLYMFVGLDWPFFLTSFLVFLALTGSWKRVLRNPFNCIPLLCALANVVWIWGRWKHYGIPGALKTLWLYPFTKIIPVIKGGVDEGSRTLSHFWETTLAYSAPSLVLAAIGLFMYVLRDRQASFSSRLPRSVMDATALWAVISGAGLVIADAHPTYVYVAAVPCAILGALPLIRLPRSLVAGTVGLCLLFGMIPFFTLPELTTEKALSLSRDDSRKVLAASCFVIESRPDLLTATKTAFLPREWPAVLGNYVRGPYKRIIMPLLFPSDRKPQWFTAPQILNDFVISCMPGHRIAADWLVLDTSLFDLPGPSGEFYTKLRDHPDIHWLARFPDESGNALGVGEVRTGAGTRWDDAPVMDVKALSDRYLAHYDRYSYLSKNVRSLYDPVHQSDLLYP